ncbi:MAG: MerR family transcriptional regulator [Deinococcota bacterium]
MSLRIGDLSGQTRETIKTLRYWTDQGLLKAKRGTNNYRYYPPDTPQRVAFIRGAQALGFTLMDIKDILRLREAGIAPCNHVRADLRKQLEGVRKRLAELHALEHELSKRLAWADANPSPTCNTEGCVYLLERET